MWESSPGQHSSLCMLCILISILHKFSSQEIMYINYSIFYRSFNSLEKKKATKTIWNGDYFFKIFSPLFQWHLLEWGKQLILGGQGFMLICHISCTECKCYSTGLIQKLLIPIMSLSKIWSKLRDSPQWKPMGNSHQKNGCWYSNAPFKTEAGANRLTGLVPDLRQVYYFKLLLRIPLHFSW